MVDAHSNPARPRCTHSRATVASSAPLSARTLAAPPEATDRFLKKACRFLLAALFIRVDAEGLEHVVPGRTAVFMANHVSAFDVQEARPVIYQKFTAVAGEMYRVTGVIRIINQDLPEPTPPGTGVSAAAFSPA